jgi:phage anti-repressor protein
MDFKEFLINYSFVDKNFIDDFYEIIKEDYMEKYNELLIDSELIRKWLKINLRRKFNDMIKRKFRKNIDYKIEKKKTSIGSGGHNRELIILSVNTAKKICLSTNSKMGDAVQQYFIDVELVAFKYKNYIINGLKQKMKQLENNQKPKINSDKKILYVFRALNTDLTLYKLGKTINSKNRFNTYNSGNANDIEIIFRYETENIDQVEKCVKSLLSKYQYRKKKEIYEINIEMIKKLIKDCDCKIREIDDIVKGNTKMIGGSEIEKLYMFIPKG